MQALRRGFRGHRWALGLSAAIALALAAAPGASADLDFCPAGSGAGQCAAPTEINTLRGVGVDFETGQIFVADRGNNRVDVFDQAGSFLFAFGWKVNATTPEEKLQTCNAASGCLVGSEGAGAGQFKKADRIAVDNDPASPTRHYVYVVDEKNHRVQKFTPGGAFAWAVGSEGGAEGQFMSKIQIGVGGGGKLYVLDNLPLGEFEYKHRLQRFDSAGNLLPLQCSFFEGGPATSFAVGPGGDFWEANELAGESIRHYDSSCAPQGGAIDAGIETNLLALDEAGRLIAARSEGSLRILAAFDGAGATIARFGYGKIPSPLGRGPEGLAARAAAGGGDILSLSEVGLLRRLDFPIALSGAADLPPPGPIATGVEVKKPVGASRAFAIAKVNPEGERLKVHVEYLTQAQYEAQGNSFEGPATKKTAEEEFEVEGFDLVPIEVLIGCPDPASEFGQPGSGCLAPETEYRFRVIAKSVTGEAGEGTVEGEPFKTGPPIEIGDTYATDPGTDAARLAAEVNPQGVPATGYFEYVDDAHFQVSGFAGASKAPDVDHGAAPLDFGAGEGAFTTRTASIFPLGPGTLYHYRLVADDAAIEPIEGAAHTLRTFAPPTEEACPANAASRIGAGALLPDCRAYELVSPLDKEGGDIRVLKAALEARPVVEQADPAGEKLAYGAARSFGGAASAPWTSQYIARRIAGREWETHPINLPRGRPLLNLGGQTDTELKALSEDLCRGWYVSFAELPEGEGVPGYVPGYDALLRRSDGLCGPEGLEALAPLAKPPGKEFFAELLGLSADGSQAIFTTASELAAAGTEGQRQLYETVEGGAPGFVCFLPGGAPVGGSCNAGSNEEVDPGSNRRGSLTGAISADGERVFFSVPGAQEGKLYVRIVGAGQSVAVSQAGEAQAGTSASWFWGAASDGSRAVFSTGEPGSVQGAKLYGFEPAGKATSLLAEGVRGVMGMSEDAKRVYFVSVKALVPGAEEGAPNLYLREAGGGTSFVATLAAGDVGDAASKEAFRHSARVSPDGLHAAFTSTAPPAGYDNVGASSGQPTRELYLYDAGSGELHCVSCNPSGARPAGPASIPAFQNGLHGALLLTPEGSRVYFESADKLTGRDSNGHTDVYQWEEPGRGSCTEQSAGFSAQAGGCVDLISSGQAPLDARFVEADPAGENVFFATAASLLPQDFGLVDIYDARAGGGLPIPPTPRPPCEGDACHAQIAAPEAKAPASSTYVAPHRPKARCPRGKRSVKHQGKVRCVPNKPKHGRHRRAAR